ncbi:MAG TPA: hypothetical protein VEI02_05445 [Planctomycetota bacterium]|nr:hypothetical protein [Planctomycetota bacterium]
MPTPLSREQALRLMHRALDVPPTPAERDALDRALAGDPTLAAERDAWLRLRAELRADAAATTVRPGLAAEIAAAARRGPAPVIVGPWRRAAGVAAATLVAAALFGLGHASARNVTTVTAGPATHAVNEAATLDSLKKMGLSDAAADAVLEVRRDYESKRRDAVSEATRRLDREEREAIWRRLSEEDRARWRAHDPDVMPKEPAEGR